MKGLWVRLHRLMLWFLIWPPGDQAIRFAKICAFWIFPNSDTTNGSIRGPKAIGVAEGLLAPLKVLQLRHLPTAGVGEQRTCLSLGP